jgi:hypothetical protein
VPAAVTLLSVLDGHAADAGGIGSNPGGNKAMPNALASMAGNTTSVPRRFSVNRHTR